jgi:ABC-type branched-subunit amino acid transport system ATPase component
VRLFGSDITGLAVHRIALRGMVRTFQLARELGRLTVLENVMLAARTHPGERLGAVFFTPAAVARREDEVFGRAMELLDLVGLSGVVDSPAEAVSGGQKKLLELARALMLDAEVILLDEPAAGVNPALMENLAGAIETINKAMKRTFLIIEHDMALVARLCSHVTVMGEGRLLSEGTFQSVSSDARVVEAYLGGGDG